MDADVLQSALRGAQPPTSAPICCSPTLSGSRRSPAGADGLQIVYAGKAHPQDEAGKEQIRRVFQRREQLRDKIKIAYLENYSMEIGKLMTAGVDLWLNTPLPPMEASGTSGMKAAVNGVPSLSVLDGWWIEGCIEGVTGWSIGAKDGAAGVVADHSRDAASLYTSSNKSFCRNCLQSRRFHRSDASCHRAQRLVFQYSSNVAAVCVEGLLLNGTRTMRWVRLMPQLKSGRLSKLSALRLCALRRTQRAAVIIVIRGDELSKDCTGCIPNRWPDCHS